MHLRGKNGRLSLPEVAIRDFLSKTENATATLFTSTQNLSSTHQAIFGRFSDFVIGSWGVSIQSDPYTLISQNVIQLTIGLRADCNVLRGPSFVVSNSTREHFVLSTASTVFFSISMTGDIFIFR